MMACVPLVVHSACGVIPATYVMYSSVGINLEKHISVNGNTVNAAIKSPNAVIDTNGIFSNNVSLSLPSLDPVTFPPNAASNYNHISSSTIFNSTTEIYYKDIKLQNTDIAVSFTGGGPFHIGELKTEYENATINFATGTYYIKKFTTKLKNITINVTSSPVIIHIGENFIIGEENASINVSGNVDDFIVYLHSNATFHFMKKNVNFTGLIYGPTNAGKVVIVEEDINFRGAILVSGGSIETNKETNSFTYTSADQVAIGNLSTCSNDSEEIIADSFNCVENDANGITGKLYTKTTAQSFSFDVVALRDSSTIETDFASSADQTVTVELVDSHSAGSCSAYSALNPVVSQSLLFSSSDAGTKASASMSSNTAYSEVKCRVTDATDSTSIVVGCSTDSFSIRPTDFTLISSMTNTGSSGVPIAKAGDDFTLTASTTSGYTGTPKIDTAKLQAHSGAINVGTITGSFSAATSGIAIGNNFIYSEVGSLRFAAEGIYDDTFTSVDSATECTNDFSNTAVSGKVGCKFGNTITSSYFGRFTPDHFVLSDASLENRNNLSCSIASSFTYTGESFQARFILTAENANNATTLNYNGDFAKLDNSVINNFNFGAIDLADTTTPFSATELTSSLIPVSSSGSWLNGDATITTSLGVARTTTNGSFESFKLGVAPVDSDGIMLSAYEMDTSVPSNSNDRSLLATTKIRFGRLNIDNAHGSELLPLPVNVYTEYFNGTSFVMHTDDMCTPISISQLNFNGGANPITIGTASSTATIANNPLVLGKASLSLSTPGTNNTGFINITSSTFITSFPWLNFDWDGNGTYDNSPSARATFGIYKGNSKQIYFREIY